MAREPEHDYRDTVLVDPEELARELNQLREEYRLEGSLASWFEEMAARRRSSRGDVGDEELSYRELNEQANQLAHYLRRRAWVQNSWLVCISNVRCGWW